MANRGPGEGTVFQRQDGRWQASLMIEGKRRTVYGKTKAEARAKLAGMRQQSSVSGLPDPGKRTVDDLIEQWLATATNLKASTSAHHRLVCETYIRPALGHMRLSRLTPDRLQAFYATLQDRPSVADKVHRVLHRAFRLAVLWRWLGENPCDRVIRPTYRAERRDVWTVAELRAFLDGTTGHWLHPFWVVAIVTGCRSGELRALAWEDVDVDAGTVMVGKTLHRLDGDYTLTAPKTRAAVRTLSLPKEGVVALRIQRAQQAEWRPAAGRHWEGNGLVFTGEAGNPLHRSVPLNALKRECERLGLPVVTAHGLRHLHASLLLSQGLPVPAVSERMGHAHAGVTLAIYAHALKRDGDEAVRAIDRALAGGAR